MNLEEKLDFTFKEIDYRIKRETITINFNDINEIYQEIKYYLFLKEKINSNAVYRLETPFPYFRIPEKYIRDGTAFKLDKMATFDFIEKIIWYYIFEEILSPDNDKWEIIKENIKNRLSEIDVSNELKRWEYENIVPENIKNELDNIEILNFLNTNDNFKKVVNYFDPINKRKIHHNSRIEDTMNLAKKSILCISLVLILIAIFFSSSSLLYFYILSGIGVFLIILLYLQGYFILQKNKFTIMLDGVYSDKFDILFNYYISESIKPLNEKIYKLYLDNLIEDLNTLLYQKFYDDIEIFFTNYKTFNPISLEIFLDKKRVYPLETRYEGFFHNTAIPFSSSDIISPGYLSLTFKIKKTLESRSKDERITKENPEEINWKYSLLIFIAFVIYSLIFLIGQNFFPLLIGMIIFLSTIGLIGLNQRISYDYYSPLSDLLPEYAKQNYRKKRKEKFPFVMNKYKFEINKKKEIFQLPIKLRKDCSYYFLAYAPRFHDIKITDEMIKNLGYLNLKVAYDTVDNIISFNLPRNRDYFEGDFYIDLELPLSSKIKRWKLGIIIMFIFMFASGIIHLVLILFYQQQIYNQFSDIFTLRFVFSFLTLLMGFFGRDILGQPTIDLQNFAKRLIIYSIIVAIIFFLPLIIFFFKPMN
jgi:hypothetical protein